MVSSRKFSYSCKVQWPEKLIERKIQRVKRLQNESSESSGYFFWWIIKTLWIVNSKWKYKVLNITSPKINGHVKGYPCTLGWYISKWSGDIMAFNAISFTDARRRFGPPNSAIFGSHAFKLNVRLMIFFYDFLDNF